MLDNKPGFLTTPDEFTLNLELDSSKVIPNHQGLTKGKPIGVLGIDLKTRRRNRLNGHIQASSANTLSVQVAQSYGNCPKFIVPRSVDNTAQFDSETTVQSYAQLTPEDRALITAADTFFVATFAETNTGEDNTAQKEVDISHRGGEAGFIRLSPEGVLSIPDYAGNRFYNTLGNIYATEKAGLLFIDFTNGTLLQITGEAKLDFTEQTIAAFSNAEHVWHFKPQCIHRHNNGTQLRWVND